ncbi:MAG: zinc ribbon domain-containing protein [Firmicutes bacterium]|nr:zinc ribbon domain-containing protein [Bacillota bacterium]
MFCNKCGNQIPEGVQFCAGCGAPTSAAEAPPQAQQPFAQQPYPPPYPQQPYPPQPYPPQYQQPYYAPPPEPDVPNKGLNVLSFFIPLVGFILYATSHQNTPIKAKAALKMSIIGMCVGVGFGVLCGVLGVVIPLAMGGGW